MKKNTKEIINKLEKELPFLKKKFDVKTIHLFGSYVRNEQTDKSDLDILVVFSKVPGLIKFLELENYLEDKLNVKIDLVMKNAIKPRLKKNIFSNIIDI